MKCNPKRTLERQYQKAREEERRKEKEYYDSLSEEEKIIYDENKRKRQEEAWNLFTSIRKTIDQMGIRPYYK